MYLLEPDHVYKHGVKCIAALEPPDMRQSYKYILSTYPTIVS